MWEYSDKVIDHFLHPRNVGEVEGADGEALVGNIACGDALKLTFKLDDNGRIQEARFKTFGCASAIASASAMTEMIKGMTIEEAARITDQDIADYLGGLPKEKIHCSVMGREALEKAIAHYKGEAVPGVEGKVICECFGVTEPEIERVVRDHDLKTVEEVTNYTKAGGGCGGCADAIQEIIDRVRAVAKGAPRRPALTNLQKIRLIEDTIQREIRPALQQDGGDLELIDVVGDRVLVATRGTCASCAAAQLTLKDFVEAKLKELVTPELRVEEVAP
jgi:NifU-like protein